MATLQIPIFGPGTRPDASGELNYEPAKIAFSDGFADELIVEFANSSTRDGMFGSFEVPDNYSAATTDPAIIVPWSRIGTSTNVVEWDFDYYAIAAGEDIDPTSLTETVNVGASIAATTKLIDYAVLTLTRGNIAAFDIIRFGLFRDGTDSGDLLAASAFVWIDDVMFRYDDA